MLLFARRQATEGRLIVALATLVVSCQPELETFLPEYASVDLLIENGQVLDGLGNEVLDEGLKLGAGQLHIQNHPVCIEALG